MLDSPPRVALVHGAAPARLDGVSDYVGRLAEALSAAGVRPAVVPVHPGRGTGWWSTVDNAAARVAAARPDVVHVQFAPSAFRFSRVPGLLLPHLLSRRVPLVTTLHEYGDPPAGVWPELEHGGLLDRDAGRLVPASRALVVTNVAHARSLYRRTGRFAVRLPLAPNVDVAPVAPGTRERVRADLGLPPDAPVLVFFGFVHPVKGLRYLIEALPALRARHPDLHLLVVGGLPSLALPQAQAHAFRVELASLAGGLGLSRAVTFTGYRPAAEASALLSAADLAVLPFTAGVTGKSGALLTVLAHRLPTVVTVPDRPEPDLADGRTVVYAAGRRDPGALAGAVGRVLADRALAERVARGGRQLVAARTWPALAIGHCDLYAALLPARQVGPAPTHA
ncbi:MAG: D-inositol-3-phosphate glycosyltransferase [Micromonosporaceae bacterium]